MLAVGVSDERDPPETLVNVSNINRFDRVNEGLQDLTARCQRHICFSRAPIGTVFRGATAGELLSWIDAGPVVSAFAISPSDIRVC